MTSLRVLGLDLSLTSTGLSDGFGTEVIQTGTDQCLEERLDTITHGVIGFVLRYRCDLAVIEGASYGSRGSGVEQLAGIRLMVRHRLWRLRVPFTLVAPSTLKSYVTGNGNASKPQMVAAVDERYGTSLASFKVKDGRYDRADAFGLAAMGYDHVGQPLAARFPAPPPHRAALDKVTWPDLLSD